MIVTAPFAIQSTGSPVSRLTPPITTFRGAEMYISCMYGAMNATPEQIHANQAC